VTRKTDNNCHTHSRYHAVQNRNIEKLYHVVYQGKININRKNRKIGKWIATKKTITNESMDTGGNMKKIITNILVWVVCHVPGYIYVGEDYSKHYSYKAVCAVWRRDLI
jgi:hypothetical protein